MIYCAINLKKRADTSADDDDCQTLFIPDHELDLIGIGFQLRSVHGIGSGGQCTEFTWDFRPQAIADTVFAARQAMRELQQVRRAWQGQGDAAASARALSRLLRRYALARFPGQRAAALTGEDWLSFLDAHGGGGRFRDGPGRLLADAIGPFVARAAARS